MKFSIRTLFLIDCLGALLSALMLGVVLVMLQSHFGMPIHILYPLAGAACLLAAYSGLCFLARASGSMYLRIIAVANWMYCMLTIGLVVCFYSSISAIGIGYFMGEVLLITVLASFEWCAAAKHLN